MIRDVTGKVIQSHALRAIALALVLLVGGEFLLAWQYQRLAGERVQELEARVEEQGQVIEERAAQDALEGFLDARVRVDERKITRYITEEAMLQRTQGLFELYGVQDYEIKKRDQTAEGIFRFQVSIIRDRAQEVEFVEVKKLLNQYYINSVELAG
jgi:hypothetical protein